MPRTTSAEALAQIVQSLGDTNKLDRNAEPQIGDGISLATLTFADGTLFNVHVHKIMQEEDKTERKESPRPGEFGKKVKLKLGEGETTQASSG